MAVSEQGYRVLLGGLFILTAACTGQLGSPGENSGAAKDPLLQGDQGSGLLPESGETTGDPALAGQRVLRPLSQSEYDSTVRDLLGTSLRPASAFAQDPLGEHGFSDPALITSERVRNYASAAEELANDARPRLKELSDCDVEQQGEEECVRSFISEFGRRAYRQPLTEEEQGELFALYQTTRSEVPDSTVEDGQVLLIRAMLQSPRFLYHRQSDGEMDGDVARLGPYELASRLSYLLWGSMPDSELFEAAAARRLESDEDVATQVIRMLADAKAAHAIERFHDEWLGLSGVLMVSKDPTLFPDFSDELKASLLQESLLFSSYVVTQGDGRLETLMTAPFSLMNEDVAKFYGVSGVSGADYQLVQYNDERRGGIMTHASVIAAESNPATTNPARAGAMVLNKFLCDSIPPPPAGVTAEFVMVDSDSVRQNFERLETGEYGPSCQGCHEVINPLGYGFESFDAIGRSRTHDGVHPVDASGSVASTAGVYEYDDLVGLGAALYSTPEFRSCYAKKWMRFALGRMESESDLYSLETAYQRFAAAEFDIALYLESLAKSRTFRFRSLEEGETL